MQIKTNMLQPESVIEQQITKGAKNPVHSRSFGLDLARTIAISFVIIAHFANKYDEFGFWGVELFFGLSGFLIGQILWRSFSTTKNWNGKKIFNFWARRWWRTLPNYYLFFIVSLFFHFYVMGKIPSLARLSDFLWFGQDLAHRGGEFFGVSWSLCIEEWFYLLFPLVLFLISRIVPKKKESFIATILFFFLFCLGLREFLIGIYHQQDIREITLGRLDAIACGVAVAYIMATINITDQIKILLFCIGVVMLVVFSLVKINYNQPFGAAILIMAPLGYSMMLPLVSVLPQPASRFAFISLCIEKISLWSYSIYLCHIPILFTMYKVMGAFRDSTYTNTLSKGLALAITIGLSAFIYRYFELPVTRKRPTELKG